MRRPWKLASEIDDKGKERADRLKAVRLCLHKIPSQRQFAEFLGVNYAQYNNWERGWPIPLDYLERIVDKTPEIRGDWLLWGHTRHLSSKTLALLQSVPIDAKRLALIQKAYIEADDEGDVTGETALEAIRAAVPDATPEEISAAVEELSKKGKLALRLSRLLKNEEKS